MSVSQDLINALWRRSGGRCECASNCHSPNARCNVTLRDGQWHVHHVKSVAAGGADTLTNTLALCIPCHENTRSYGRNLTR
jgi:5-methylcytosine-specific restriction endonuclease McrA